MSDLALVTALTSAPRTYDVLPPFHPPALWPEFGDRLEQAGLADNQVFPAIRRLLVAAQLDRANYGRPEWNPLGEFIRPGDRVVLKPNWVRHFNPRGSFSALVTHTAVVRAVCDYALLATGPHGQVVIADAPQHDCDFEILKDRSGLLTLEQHYRRLGLPVLIRDLRQEAVIFQDGVVTERIALEGDPEGYAEIDLAGASAFADGSHRAGRLRGADYDQRETIRHHSGGHHRYLVSNTILRADCVINLPKIKSHKKAGITCGLKNLVGINGNKNYLPHHTTGFPGRGGDEFADLNPYTWTRRRAVEWARRRLAAGKSIKLIRSLRRFEKQTHPEELVHAGNWFGNDTIWRTVVDLNTILQYADAEGRLGDLPNESRRVLHIADGIVAGGGEGPLSPEDCPAGLLAIGKDPVALDATVAMLIGFDWRKIPCIARAALRTERPLSAHRDLSQLWIRLVSAHVQAFLQLDSCPVQISVPPHFGWRGHIERTDLENVHAASLAG